MLLLVLLNLSKNFINFDIKHYGGAYPDVFEYKQDEINTLRKEISDIKKEMKELKQLFLQK